MKTVVIGLGNALGGDDAIGPAVAAEIARRGPAGVRVQVSPGDPAALLDAWAGADLAIVVDAVRGASAAAGEVVVLHGLSGLPAGFGSCTHTSGLADAVRLGEVLDRLPARLAVVGVVAGACEPGTGLSAPVAAALPEAVRAVGALLGQSQSRRLNST